jgi:hypothetical protein
MPLTVWTQKSGFSFGRFEERLNFSQPLPVENDFEVNYSIIAGSLPPGLNLQEKTIIGTPYEVPRETTFNFCIRAIKGTEISDRTFNITIIGSDDPEFMTAAGDLAIGPNQQLFVLDSTFVDYQIEAIDTDTATGQRLSYFIASDDGELPPGLVLTDDGRIVGFVQPVLSIKPEDGSGTFDNGLYDAVAYDFAYRPTNGYDSFIYDTIIYDYSSPTFTPKKLNRNYQFTVTVTDGDTYSKRTFNIFVVGDDYFRADNNVLKDSTGLFTADNTYLRKPVWLTKSYLGTYRANNYLTLFLDVYNKDLVYFSIEDETQLPPGLKFDPNTADIYGRVPYQPAITKSYSFTVVATNYGDVDKNEVATSARTFTIDIIGEIDSVITWNTDSDLGSIDANYISTLKINASSTIPNAVVIHSITSGNLPSGLSLNFDGEIVGKVNQFYNQTTGLLGLTTFDYYNGKTTFDNDTTTIDRKFTFTVEAKDQYSYSASSKTFVLTVDTPNQIAYSNIRVKPLLKQEQRNIWSDFINDTTIFTPEYIYRPNDSNFGVQKDLSMLIYAGVETTQASAYIGAIGLNHKRKRFQFESVKKAYAVHPGTTDQIYEVIYIQMIDPLEPNNKRLPLQIKTNSNSPEAITIDKDNSFWSRSLSDLIDDSKMSIRPDPIITVDSTGYYPSTSNVRNYFPNSISNWRDRIKSVGQVDRKHLPLWMTSIQPDTRNELGFTLSIPLCYCKLGTADEIILNIKNRNFNFTVIDYTVDRYIIDAIEGQSTDKYLVFKNDRITL